MDEKTKSTIELRQGKQKEALAEQFKKTPIVQIACEKTGVGRASYYRWKKEDPYFASVAEAAIAEGASLVTDLAESQLISAIRERNFPAIVFWLKHHHPAYATKIELTTRIQKENIELTDEQKELIKKSVLLLSQEQRAEDEPLPKEETNSSADTQ